MIQSLLIANRGEIACRVIRTARRLGIRTVAVYSEADAHALHVRMADEAVAIGPAPARESYLVGERIIAAAKQTGAEAIHPGYGFLSENADFAEAVIAAGLIWVGPRPSSIRAMGLKDAAKTLMQQAGVPTTPGYLGEDQNPARLHAEADAIGYPVLIKAVAGGGGKGMRRVDAGAEFLDALASCQREAASSFGDDRVLIEKYILSPRHIEVQVFGDTHGNVVHLFERDCSLQRRHQKVIEEAPAPGMDEATRAAVCGAAVKAAQAVDYVGAGTIEFIADASEGLRADRIWFMEMNTRLQVEHPVTEEITGQDLVEWQLRVASGEALPKRQDELSINGWAIEARLYAEDPARDFLPSVGKFEHFSIPTDFTSERYFNQNIGTWSRREYEGYSRVERGVEEGDEISPFYDPMIAKLIWHADERIDAIRSLARMVSRVESWPVRTNSTFLRMLLDDAGFLSGNVHTGLIEQSRERLTIDLQPHPTLLTVAAMALAKTDRPVAPAGFRLNAESEKVVRLSDRGTVYEARLDRNVSEGFEYYGSVKELDGAVLGSMIGTSWRFTPAEVRGSTAGVSDGALTAPMPGRIVAVEVAAGDTVTKGQRIVVIEAMKMEQALLAPFDGVVAELPFAAGAQVSEGTLLAKIETEDKG